MCSVQCIVYLVLLAQMSVITRNTSTTTSLTRSGRILGGKEATPGQFPFLVYIESVLRDYVSTQSCGGVILNADHVLTAAQCVVLAGSIKVVAGVLDPTDTAAQIAYGWPIIHPNYKRNFQTNDVAIVRLLRPLLLAPGNAYPIKILKGISPNLDKTYLTTAGWGPADESTSVQTTVHFVELVQLTRPICNKRTAQAYIIYPAMTSCLDNSDGRRGFCYGDAGGPVVYQFPTDDGRYTLVGILSQYQQCPYSLPMSYTRIGPYYGWIKQTVTRLEVK